MGACPNGEQAGDLWARTENERFKERARRWTWYGLAAAAVAHALIFLIAPGMGPVELAWAPAASEMRVVELEPPPPVEVPSPPAPLVRPAAPEPPRLELPGDLVVVAEPSIEETIRAPEIPIPARPKEAVEELADFEHFMPYMVQPELVNRSEVARALEREYPRALQNRGIEGSVVVWFWIDEEGKVRKYEIRQSSGHAALDEAAVRVIPIMKFRPARRHGEPIRVIVALPIRFELE
jgi:protein TonB